MIDARNKSIQNKFKKKKGSAFSYAKHSRIYGLKIASSILIPSLR